MDIKYSPSTKGFYFVGLHSNIPEDSIDVTKEQHQQVLDEQSQGRIITVVDGVITTVENSGPTEEELAEQTRNTRDYLLSKSDWVVIKATETATPVPQAWLDYRQALRDITDQPGFPSEVTFPVAPGA